MKKKVLTSILACCILLSLFANAQVSQAKTYVIDNGKQVKLSGKLRKEEIKDRRFTEKITYYILKLNKDIKLKNPETGEINTISEVDVYQKSNAQLKKLKKSLGKKIKVKGYFTSEFVKLRVTYTGVAFTDAVMI